ncbi:hypothetical protein, partial [Stenoxybacter acetivorans]|uniref:hypothetical protein n=1 Tax=Stenoxybacter acetivorans TaxID=422441 RepID=UPI000567449C
MMKEILFNYEKAQEEFDYIVSNINQVGKKELDYINDEDAYWQSDLNILEAGGKDFLLEPLQTLQPLSYAVLSEYASEYYVGFQWFNMPPIPTVPINTMYHFGFLLVKNRLIWVNYKDCISADYLKCFPKNILDSWFKNSRSWGVSSTISPVNLRLLLSGFGGASAFIYYLPIVDKNWKRNILPVLKEKIPDLYNGDYPKLRCFLDSRLPESKEIIGDQLYIVARGVSQKIYWVKDFDFINIHYLENPAEALDAYCAHTLL